MITAFENAMKEHCSEPGLISAWIKRANMPLVASGGYRLTQHMSDKDGCFDNASIKHLFRDLKTEWLTSARYKTVAVDREDLGRYLLGC